MAAPPAYPLLTAEEFFEIDFGEHKAELDNGVIRIMAGGGRRHARVSGNILLALASRLRGSGCAAYPSDMAVRTCKRSVRYPDVSVYCGREDALFDIANERLRVVQRTGQSAWTDTAHDEPHDISLPSLAFTLPHTEIFARN